MVMMDALACCDCFCERCYWIVPVSAAADAARYHVNQLPYHIHIILLRSIIISSSVVMPLCYNDFVQQQQQQW